MSGKPADILLVIVVVVAAKETKRKFQKGPSLSSSFFLRIYEREADAERRRRREKPFAVAIYGFFPLKMCAVHLSSFIASGCALFILFFFLFFFSLNANPSSKQEQKLADIFTTLYSLLYTSSFFSSSSSSVVLVSYFNRKRQLRWQHTKQPSECTKAFYLLCSSKRRSKRELKGKKNLSNTFPSSSSTSSVET